MHQLEVQGKKRSMAHPERRTSAAPHPLVCYLAATLAFGVVLVVVVGSTIGWTVGAPIGMLAGGALAAIATRDHRHAHPTDRADR